jgi:hypothetical protein
VVVVVGLTAVVVVANVIGGDVVVVGNVEVVVDSGVSTLAAANRCTVVGEDCGAEGADGAEGAEGNDPGMEQSPLSAKLNGRYGKTTAANTKVTAANK